MHIDIQERMFYNWIVTKGFLSDIGGILVENCNEEKESYRQQIIQMVKKVERCDILVYIYKAVLGVIDEEKEIVQNKYSKRGV